MAMQPALSPTSIIDLAVAFWGAKTLLSAVELHLFTVLAPGPLERDTLAARLQLHPRAARDFLDALVALGMLVRTGETYAKGNFYTCHNGFLRLHFRHICETTVEQIAQYISQHGLPLRPGS
jgi:DNA-binding IclR family transcriptional regulator